MAQPETEIVGTGGDPARPPSAGAWDVLHAFYLHLGRCAARGRVEDSDQDHWQEELTRAGFADLADAYENLQLLRESPEVHAQGLVTLLGSTGSRLRSTHVPRYEDATEGPLPEPDVSGVTPPEPAAPEGDEEAPGEQELKRHVQLLRVGTLSEKRVAAEKLGMFLQHRRKLVSEELGQMVMEAVISNRDSSLTVELTEAIAPLAVTESKRARAAIDRKNVLFDKLERRIRSFWDGASTVDPLDNLVDSDLVTLGLWLRRGSDYIAGHAAEYMIHRLTRGDNRSLASMVSAMVPSGDQRILAVLIRVLQDAQLEARVAAIKAIAHIDDPRSIAALCKARRHASDTLERVMLARALASLGVYEGSEDILDRIGDDTPEFVREEALKALGLLPDVSDEVVEELDGLLDGPSPAISLATLRALSYLGNADTVERLQNLATTSAPLRAAASRASGDLRARLALGGDERFELATTVITTVTQKRPSMLARLRSVMWYLMGLVLYAVRRRVQARAAAARASAINPVSAKGHFLEALIRVKEGNDEAALACYRRGLKVDPSYAVSQWGEANHVLQAYLRHADELVRKYSRRDEAIELLEETEFIDLRSADPNLKIEVDRRLETLKLERRRERLSGEDA